MNVLRREWGAVTFVATVLIGAVAVAISLIVSGSHAPPTPALASCPSYTPYVLTPTPSSTATPAASTSHTTTASSGPTPTAFAGTPATAAATPSPTVFNPALVNCPTPPLPPSSTPTPTPSPHATTSTSTRTSSTASH